MNSSDHWNSKYAQSTCLFGKQVNELATKYANKLPTKARILNIGDGEAFNSFYLANLGHQVTSLDSSRVAQKHATAIAAEMNLKVEFQCTDIFDYAAKANHFDMISLFFVHVDGRLKTALAERICAHLKPGGIFLFECFHLNHQSVSEVGPKSADSYYTEDEIYSLYSKLKVLQLQEKCSLSFREDVGNHASRTLQFVGLRN